MDSACFSCWSCVLCIDCLASVYRFRSLVLSLSNLILRFFKRFYLLFFFSRSLSLLLIVYELSFKII